jgi:hypothetical protein
MAENFSKMARWELKEYARKYNLVGFSKFPRKNDLLRFIRRSKIAVRFSLNEEKEVKRKLLASGFDELSFLEEIKEENEMWGMAIYTDENNQLHVRAFVDPERDGMFYLSAHREARRDRPIAHLMGKPDYFAGNEMVKKLFKNFRKR